MITATSSERNLKDAPASISVISGEELRERPVSDLADALEGTPGITITGVGLGRHGISVRGMQPDHTLILVDGMRISNSSSAVAHSDFELDWVPSEAIERVEVVRGPMSSPYGSEALGGVVNVITRRATDHWQSSISMNGLFTEHGLGGHQYNFSGYTGGLIIPGEMGFNVWGAFKGRSELSSPDNKQGTSLGDYKAFTGNAALIWTPDERQRIDLGYTGGYENRWSNMQGSGPFSKAYRSEDDIWRQRISLSHEGNWDWGTSRVRVYSALLNRENERSDNALVSGPQKFIDTVGDGQISFSPLEDHKITLGGELRQERLKDPTVNHSGRTSQMHHRAFSRTKLPLAKTGKSFSVAVLIITKNSAGKPALAPMYFITLMKPRLSKVVSERVSRRRPSSSFRLNMKQSPVAADSRLSAILISNRKPISLMRHDLNIHWVSGLRVPWPSTLPSGSNLFAR